MAGSTTQPTTKSDAVTRPLQRSLSLNIDSQPAEPSLKCSLHHGFQMDLKQAVQLEKQELRQLGLLPPNAVATALPKALTDDTCDCSSPPYWLYHQQRLVRKAASFSSGQHGCLPPVACSPPVPIPQTQRRFSVGGNELQLLSTEQCKARLWDEFWNYKLSFEARESFETLKVDRETALKDRSESSMTTDTVVEDEDSDGPEDAGDVHRYGDVFEMDDLEA